MEFSCKKIVFKMQKIIYEKKYGFREMKWRDTMDNKIFSYMRISTNSKKQSTDRQQQTIIEYSIKNGFKVDEFVSDIITGGTKADTDVEMKLLYEQFCKDYHEQPEYIPTYAVEFASLTGFRVAEISALKWENVTDEYILVDKSEKYNRKTKEYYIDKTKNQKERLFPLTEEIRSLLNRVKKAEIKAGYVCEWVFANEEGRIHAPVISSCIKNKCRQVGITEKGIHAYRKTVNSKMRCNGVSSVVAASLLGHSQAVNEEYYTFDVATLDDKARVVSEMNHQMMG